MAQNMYYRLYSLWLFTYSDIKTIIIPKILFGIATLLSGRNLTNDNCPAISVVIRCIPLIMLWTWLNLLPLDVNNQRGAESILEDKANKPWRPIAAGRLTAKEAQILMFGAYAIALYVSPYLGCSLECIAIILAGWVYNVMEGANQSFLARNLLNALGYMLFASGAAKVACTSSKTQLRQDSLAWFFLLGGVIATTIQFQDLYDQKGDALRGRRTIPLLAGDRMARLTISIPIAIWSFACPMFWRMGLFGFVVPVGLGSIITVRLYRYRSVYEDKRSFLVWNAWIMSLYFLPVFAHSH